MSLNSDSDALETNIKAKLNSHVKKRIKQTGGGQKRKIDIKLEDSQSNPEEGPSNRKQPTKVKGKKNKSQDDDDSDKGAGDAETSSPPHKVSTLDVLQLLLNDRKQSLMRDKDVIEFIRLKQSHFRQLQ